jgi:hypothetical protein
MAVNYELELISRGRVRVPPGGRFIWLTVGNGTRRAYQINDFDGAVNTLASESVRGVYVCREASSGNFDSYSYSGAGSTRFIRVEAIESIAMALSMTDEEAEERRRMARARVARVAIQSRPPENTGNTLVEAMSAIRILITPTIQEPESTPGRKIVVQE